MNKDFDEFMKLMDSKSWSKVIDTISNDISNIDDPIKKSIRANAEVTVTILREYHNWLNQQ